MDKATSVTAAEAPTFTRAEAAIHVRAGCFFGTSRSIVEVGLSPSPQWPTKHTVSLKNGFTLGGRGQIIGGAMNLGLWANWIAV